MRTKEQLKRAALAFPAADQATDRRSKLIRNRQGGRPAAILANAVHALRHTPEWCGVLAYDDFALRVSARSAPPFPRDMSDHAWTDEDDRRTEDWLQWQGIQVGIDVAGRAVQTAAHDHPFHPVRTYLNTLVHETGARRFWPMVVGNIDLAALRQDRDQLWAEAVQRYREKEPWWITDAPVAREVAEEQASRFQTDAWQDVIADYLHGTEPGSSVTIRDVLAKVAPPRTDMVGNLSYVDWDQSAAIRVARILKVLGWERFRQRRGRDPATGKELSEWRYRVRAK